MGNKRILPKKVIEFDKLFWNENKKFKKKIKNINKLLRLKENKKFISTFPPTFFCGNIYSNKIKYIFVGLNPGYNKKYNRNELKWRENKRKESPKPLYDCLNFFDYFKDYKISNYYSRRLNFCKNYPNKNKNAKINFCKDYILNIDVLPFHSINNNISIANLTPKQLKEIFDYWNITKKIIKNINGKFVIISGKENYRLLMMDREFGFNKFKLVWESKNKVIHIYKFKFYRKRGILIDNFLGGNNRTISKHLSKIKQKIKELCN